MKKALSTGLAALLATTSVKAHCPLCTAGAAAAAGGAAYMGVGTGPIGVFIGAFAVAVGLWVHRALKKQYVPAQKAVLAVLSWATTILPLRPLMTTRMHALYLPIGEYGTTLPVDAFLVGSLLGAGLMLTAPTLSKYVTQARGEKVAYQGIMVAFGTLIIAAGALQVLL